MVQELFGVPHPKLLLARSVPVLCVCASATCPKIDSPMFQELLGVAPSGATLGTLGTRAVCVRLRYVSEDRRSVVTSHSVTVR